MINVGGEKVYPNEVEQVLYRHPAVAEAAVYGVPHAVMGEEVKASVVLKDGQQAHGEGLIDFCRQYLAHFKLPTTVEFVASLPKTRTGKVLKRALRAETANAPSASETGKPGMRERLLQETSTDARRALLLQRVQSDIRGILGRDIASEESLFAAGMDSLMGIQLVNRLSTGLGIDLPSTLAMEHPTLTDLVRHLADAIERDLNGSPRIDRELDASEAVGIYDWFAQSPIQTLYFDWHEAAENKSFMNMRFLLHVRSEIDEQALRDAHQSVIDRHSALRLGFCRQEGRPMQKVQRHQEADFVATRLDCATWSSLADQIRGDSSHPFDLRSDPLMRVHLYSRAVDDHILMIVRHHIINDRTTGALVTDELLRLYHANTGGPPAQPLRAPSYFEFMRWHERMLSSPEGEQHWEYWRDKLAAPLEPLALPTDFPRRAKNRHYGDAISVAVDAELTASLKRSARDQGVTLYTLMMAGYAVLFHFLTGQRDLLVDTSTVNRTQQRFEKTIGQLSIIHTIRTLIPEHARFPDLLQQVAQTVKEALQHQSYPSARLSARLGFVKGQVHDRPGQVLFNLISANLSRLPLEQPQRCGLLLAPATIVSAGSAGTFHEINTQFVEWDGTLVGHINYETDLYKRSTIEALMGDYLDLLRKIVSNPNQSVDALRSQPQ
jgi:acyl carrier protein